MVKKLWIIILLCSQLSMAEDAFEKNCVPCHKSLETSLEEMFKNYLLLYSSEANVKIGIENYLRFPSKEVSAMSRLFITTYGVKQKIELNTNTLREAIDIYWEKYKVMDKLQ